MPFTSWCFSGQGCANLNEMYVAAGRNALYAQQGRVSANDYAERPSPITPMTPP